MNNPGLKEEIWLDLCQKWDRLIAEGHTVKAEFNLLKHPEYESKILAIDVAQNIDGDWHVQTVQRQAQEAYPVIAIDGLMLDQLIALASHVVDSLIEPVTGQEAYDDELHLFMRRISPETSEMYGHIISKAGEKIGVRANYQHYYVINEILEQISKITKEEYVEIQLHRNKDDFGTIYFQFIPA